MGTNASIGDLAVVNTNKGKPDDKRVDALYEKLRGPILRGSRHQVQQIVYVEEACRSVIEAIDRLAASESPEEVKTAVQEFQCEFDFLRTLTNDKEFLHSFHFLSHPIP